MKISTSKTKMAKRLKSLLLILAMTLTMVLPFAGLTVSAAPYTANDSLDAAIAAALTPAQQANPSLVIGLNLSGKNIYGDVDIASLQSVFANLAALNLSNNNITGTVPGTITPNLTDTFADGTRSFAATGAPVVFAENTSGYPNLPVASLLNAVEIITAGGNIPIPAGMLSTGTVTIGSNPPISVSPTGTIDVTSIPGGTYPVSFNFPVTYASSSGAALSGIGTDVTLQIKKAGYFLSPASGAVVYDGGSVDFTFTINGADGNPASVGVESDYVVELDIPLSTTAVRISDTKVSADGMSMKITVKAADFILLTLPNTSVTLQVYDVNDYGTGSSPIPGAIPLAEADLVWQANAVLYGIQLSEYNATGTPPSPPEVAAIGATLYVNGGTTISSAEIASLGTYSTTTTYYIKGDINGSGIWNYIPTRYESQFDIDIGELLSIPYDLAADIVHVPNPLNPAEDVLALVVTAKTSVSVTYTWNGSTPTTMPITITLNNSSGGAAQYVYIEEVEVFSNTALGYIIYQVPDIYDAYTKAQIETAIDLGDPRIKMVGQYELISAAWTLINGTGTATIVEDSTIYLVAAAYYQTGGKTFIVPDSMINGWYDVTSTMVTFGSGFIPIATTSMEAQIVTQSPPAIPLAISTKILEVRTDGWKQTKDPEEIGKLRFAPKGSTNNLEILVEKEQKEIIAYVISDPAYTPPLGGANVYAELDLQIAAVNAMVPGTYIPGTYRLYDLNVACKDTIAIGATKPYEIWTVYSNYKLGNTYTASVAGDVSMVSSVSPVPVSAAAVATNNELVNAVCTSNGGIADALAGSKVYMTYDDGAISSPTLELTILNSEVNGLYLVFEDLLGNLYSSAPALYGNANFDIGQLTANFEIPEGTIANVHTVFSFGNSSFFAGMTGLNDWRAYIANPANVSVSIVPGTGALGDLTASAPNILNGVNISQNNSVSAAWTGALIVTINSTVFNVPTTTASGSDLVDVIPPIVTGIRARNASVLVPNNNNPALAFIVGDKWDTDPDVRLSGTTGDVSLSTLTLGTDYIGDITLVPNPNPATDPNVIIDPDGLGNDYEIGFWNQVTGLKISYEYTYTVNGIPMSATIILPATATSVPYVANVNVGHPTIEGIYLVAADPSAGKLKWWDGAGAISGSVNEYTLPYTINGTVKLYPVIMNSRANLGGFTAPVAIEESDVDGIYYNFIKASDFSSPGTWTKLLGKNSDYIGTPKTDTSGYVYYEVWFRDQVDFANYLDFEFDSTALVLNASAPYSGTGTGYADTLQLFHLPDADSAYVVDITASDTVYNSNTPPAYNSNPIVFDIKYYLSLINLGGTFDVPVTYFDTPLKTMMPGSANYNSSERNALVVTPIKTPTGNNPADYDPITSTGSQLSFVAHVPGEYVFRLTTINNAGVLAPNFAPGYEEIKFTLNSPQQSQTIYWKQVDPITPALPSGWATIQETGGTNLLDPVALGSGYLKMASNTDGFAVVKVYNAAGIELATVNVTTVSANPNSAALNHSTSYTSPFAMAHNASEALFWEVTYLASDASTYILGENIDASTWAFGWSEWGADLALAGGYVTADVSSAKTDGVVSYSATYGATSTTEFFWAKIDPNATPASYNYKIQDSSGADVSSTAAVGTVTMFKGDSETFNVWDILGTPAAVGVSLVNNSNTSYTHAFTASGADFTVYALDAGTSVITIYPATGGSIDIIIDVVLPSYTLTYDANGGINAPAPVTAVSGTTITLAGQGTMTNGTDTFLGWGTTSTGGSNVSGSYTINGNVTLYAQWAPAGTATYTLTYDANGGINAPAPVTAVSGTTITLAGQGTMAKGTDTFLGWGTSATSGANVSGSYTINGSVTLYAQWAPAGTATYTLTYDANGGINAPAAVANIVSGTTITLAGQGTMAKGTDTFLGWGTSATGGANVSGSYTVIGNVTLYAQWAPLGATTYTVTYDANGGINAPAPVTAVSGTQLVLALRGNMTKGTDTFLGWGTSATGGANVSSPYTVTGNVTLYAQWQPSGGGSGGGGGGGGGMPSGGGGGGGIAYNIKVSAGDGGSASSDLIAALPGTTITITVRPKSGYETKSVSVSETASTSIIPVSKVSETKYSFIMPAADVTVTLTFEEAEDGMPDGPGPDGPDGPDGTEEGHICPSEPYVDLDLDMWYHEYTDYVIGNGLMQGTNTSPLMFEPDTKLSRAMMVQILYNMEGKPEVNGEQIFDDVPVGSWYFDAIAWADAYEIVFGYGNDKFGPDDPVTREQMVAILYRYSDYKGYDISASADLSGFADAGDVSVWAVPAMKWAVGSGLIIGRDGNQIAPLANATRAEVATIVTRFCKMIVIEAEEADDEEDEEDTDENAEAEEEDDETDEDSEEEDDSEEDDEDAEESEEDDEDDDGEEAVG